MGPTWGSIWGQDGVNMRPICAKSKPRFAKLRFPKNCISPSRERRFGAAEGQDGGQDEAKTGQDGPIMEARRAKMGPSWAHMSRDGAGMGIGSLPKAVPHWHLGSRGGSRGGVHFG